LVWTCSTCCQPVANGRGYVCVDSNQAGLTHARHETVDFEYRKRQEAEGSLVPYPLDEVWDDPVPWAAYHHGCDPRPDSGDYWFAVERCRTLAEFLHWSAHLLEKRWFAHTDWRDLMGWLGVDR